MVHLGEKMVNDYERLRQENIQRNNAILSALELNSATSSTQADCSREFKKSSLERCELDFCFDVGLIPNRFTAVQDPYQHALHQEFQALEKQ